MMTDNLLPQQQQQYQHQEEKQQMELWVCDVCKVKKFRDFDKACQHEERCKKRKLAEQETAAQAEAANNSKVHPFFAAPGANAAPVGAAAAGGNEGGTNGTTKRRKTSDDTKQLTKADNKLKENVVQNGTTTDSSHNSKHPKNKPIKRSETVPAKKESSHPFFASKRPQQQKQIAKISSKTTTDDIEFVGVVKPKAPSRAAKKSKATKTSAGPAGPLASLFLKDENGETIDTRKLMAEQTTAEFQAKRRLQREQERERQRKRQEWFANGGGNASSTNAPAASSSHPSATETVSPFACPQFPVPSFLPTIHANQSSLPERSCVWVNEETLGQARSVLQKALPFTGKAGLTLTADGESTFPYNDDTAWQSQQGATNTSCGILDSIQMEFARVLAPHKVPTFGPGEGDSGDENHQQQQHDMLWVDKYPLTIGNVCGEKNQQISTEMVDFVQEWMVEREKANERMAERQAKLQKKNKKKAKKKKYKDDDEDMWSDLESDDEDDNKLPSLYLLEGPVGSGKSSLVHAVAKHCDCQVLELNTSSKRGSVDLRKALEEATQSLSSLDMLKKRQANIFAKQDLVDSDDENDKETARKGTTLSVILIDEVDNIFESDGDTAFWSALNDLTRKARCPVFLTSNAFPRGLVSSSARFRHARTTLPTKLECAHKMMQLIQQEGVCSQQDVEETMLKDLKRLAELCGCDIRNIMHELQLFASLNALQPSMRESTMSEVQSRTEILPTSAIRPVITIESVSPKLVPSSSYSLIIIKGKDFGLLSLSNRTDGPSLEVFVGDQRCPLATLVDNETILAVCLPCSIPGYVDVTGCRKTSTAIGRQSSPEARFAQLTIQSSQSTGARPISSSSVASHLLLDDNRISVSSICNVEYTFPDVAPRKIVNTNKDSDDDDSISECEFGNKELSDNAWKTFQTSFLTKKKSPGEPILGETSGLEEAKLLFTKELEKLKALTSENASQAKVDGQSDAPAVDRDIEETLDILARDLQLASDASLLDSHTGLPFLTGASPGFGYLFTPEGSSSSASSSSKLSRHGNSTQCSEERLMSLGWKDSAAFYGDNEAFMSCLVSARERKLFKVAEESGRRFLSSVEDAVTSPGDQKDDKSPVDTSQDLTMWSPPHLRTSEEDFLLCRPTPAPLLALPNILLSARMEGSSSVPPYWKQGILERRREAKADELVELVDRILCAEGAPKIFCRGLHRFSPAFLPGEFDTKLFLEYIPVLLNMAVHEQAAASCDPDGDSAAPSRRRATRKTAKKGRTHYFEFLNHVAFRWDDENTAADLGKKLASAWLEY